MNIPVFKYTCVLTDVVGNTTKIPMNLPLKLSIADEFSFMISGTT